MSSISQQQVRVRFAPSPTGHLHIGGLRTAIFNWLFAHHNNGVYLLRIEDTDIERSKKEYTDSILDSFAWMGIQADEPIVIQSERAAAHHAAVQQLIAEGKAYYCSCSQEEVIERHKKKMGSDDLFIKYDGACRGKKSNPADQKVPHAIRFALPFAKGPITFNDIIHGEITIDADQLDDFVIFRSDGTPMYNFVVVVDDAFMGITHVIRGEDHISNTPKQILLYQALGYEVPMFGHLPMILGPSGDRLSKRDGATSVLEYRRAGYLPDALLNYLVRLGWAHGDQEIFSREELIKLFSLEAVNKKASIFDFQKLAWLNGVYVRQLEDKDLFEKMVTDVDHEIRQQLAPWSDQQIIAAITLYKERIKTIAELVTELRVLHSSKVAYAPEDYAHFILPQTADHLRQVIQILEAQQLFTVDIVTECIKNLTKQLGIKLVSIAQPIRIALVGKSASPGIFDLLTFLGKEESIARMRSLIAHIEK